MSELVVITLRQRCPRDGLHVASVVALQQKAGRDWAYRDRAVKMGCGCTACVVTIERFDQEFAELDADQVLALVSG